MQQASSSAGSTKPAYQVRVNGQIHSTYDYFTEAVGLVVDEGRKLSAAGFKVVNADDHGNNVTRTWKHPLGGSHRLEVVEVRA